MRTQKEESEKMYTGTLIEDLIAAVERAEAQSGLVAQQQASSSDLMHPLGTLGDAVCLVAAEDFPLANAHMWAVPSGAMGQFGHRGPLA